MGPGAAARTPSRAPRARMHITGSDKIGANRGRGPSRIESSDRQQSVGPMTLPPGVPSV
jgi:hypothetical protein